YLPSIGWWSVFVGPSFEMRVDAFDPLFSGEAVTASAEGSRYAMTFTPVFPQQAVPVAKEDALVVVTFRMTGGDTYGAHLEIQRPEGGQPYRRTLTHLDGTWMRESFEAAPGNWRVTLAGGGSGTFELGVQTVRFAQWRL
ncbi:MAG TPA: hypothetical protein VM582_09245, partial [Candidatus Thermoplasmatota archaeon]|nr:hypothetical protein [Candidatus Thermoplasmatota archaeon]